MFSGESNQLELDGPLYLGGLGPSHSSINTPPALWTAALRQGFVGCIRDLVTNNKAIDLTSYARQQDSGTYNLYLGTNFLQKWVFVHRRWVGTYLKVKFHPPLPLLCHECNSAHGGKVTQVVTKGN